MFAERARRRRQGMQVCSKGTPASGRATRQDGTNVAGKPGHAIKALEGVEMGGVFDEEQTLTEVEIDRGEYGETAGGDSDVAARDQRKAPRASHNTVPSMAARLRHRQSRSSQPPS
jgi:hypothetical protein